MRATFSKKNVSRDRAEHQMAEQASPSGNLAYDNRCQRQGLRKEFVQSALHLSDEMLERYHLGQINDQAEQGALERHLLTCPECVGRAEKRAAYVDAIREAAQRLEPWRSRPNVLTRVAGRSLSEIS
jgi:hypothetical protein